MNRRLSDSPDNKPSFNRLASPSDQWQIRSVSPSVAQNPFNSGPENPPTRPPIPFGANPYPRFGPNFSNQRFFTPRSSYFGPQNDNLVFTSTANMNPNFNYAPNYGNYDYNVPQSRPQHSYIENSNRPVYSTDISTNISLNTEDINKLKSALMNANREPSQQMNEKSISPESTVNCDDSKSSSMDKLIAQMKILTERENNIKKSRRDVEKKITDLDEELKEYEQKIRLRDNLKTIKAQFDKEEEELVTKRQKVVSDMEKVNKLLNISTIDSKMDSNTDSNEIKELILKDLKSENEEKETKRVEIQSKGTSLPKPALKRPNPSSTKPMPLSKKVRINTTVTSSSSDPTPSPLKTTPKVSAKPPIRKTPIPSKLSLNKPLIDSTSKSTPGSPKISRLCRVKEPHVCTPLSSSVTSGVRTSRPQKMMSSRAKRTDITADTSETATTSTSTPMKPPESSAPKTSESDSIESDNEMLKELAKLSSQKDCDSNTTYKRSETCEQTSNILEKIKSEKNDNKTEEELPKTDNSKAMVTNIKTEKLATNESKDIEIVDIESSDEETNSEEHSAEPTVKVKTEKTLVNKESVVDQKQSEFKEAVDNLISKDSQKAFNLHPSASSDSSESSNTSAEHSAEPTVKVKTEKTDSLKESALKPKKSEFNEIIEALKSGSKTSAKSTEDQSSSNESPFKIPHSPGTTKSGTSTSGTSITTTVIAVKHEKEEKSDKK